MDTRLFIKILCSLVLLLNQVVANEQEKETLAGDDAHGPVSMDDGTDWPQECGYERFLALNTAMVERGIFEPDEMGPVQDLFAKCKTFLSNEVAAAVERISTKQRKLVKRFIDMADDFAYGGSIDSLAKLYEEKAGTDLPRALKEKFLFDRYFNNLLQGFMAPFKGTLSEQVNIYHIVYGLMGEKSQTETVAKKFHERSDPLTLEWITYAMIAENIIDSKDALATRLWYHFKSDEKTEPKEEPDGVDPEECTHKKFLALEYDSVVRSEIYDPDKMESVQQLFTKCKTFLKNQLSRAVKAMTPTQRNSIKGITRMSSAEVGGDLSDTVKVLSMFFEQKAGQDYLKARKNNDLFNKIFNEMLDDLMAPLEGTVLELVKIYSIVFGKLRDSSTTGNKKLRNRTDPLTVEWITYALELQKLSRRQTFYADDLWSYFQDQRKKKSILSWGPLKAFKKCTGH